MKSPHTNKEMPIITRWCTVNDCALYYYKCEDSGELFEDDGLIERNIEEVFKNADVNVFKL